MADSRIWGSGKAKPVHVSPDGKIRRCSNPANCRFKDRSLAIATHVDKDRELFILNTANKIFHDNLTRLPDDHPAVVDVRRRKIPLSDPHLGWISSRNDALRQLKNAGCSDLDLLESGLADLKADGTALQVFAHDRLTIAVMDGNDVTAYYARSYADKTGGHKIAKIGNATVTMTSGLKYVRSRPPSYMVPRRDSSGRFTEPYENPMFLLDESKPFIRRKDEVILVEGQLDALACSYAGVRNTASIAGMTDFYERQLDQCKQLMTDHGRIILCLDDDEAGLRGARSAIMRFPNERIDVCIVPDGKDPCDYRRVHGDRALKIALGMHEDGIRFLIKREPESTIPQLLANITDPVKRNAGIEYTLKKRPDLGPESRLTRRVESLSPQHARMKPGVYKERRRWVQALGVDVQSTTPGKTLVDRIGGNERLRLIASIVCEAHEEGLQVPDEFRGMIPKKLRQAKDDDPLWEELEPVIDHSSINDLIDRLRKVIS
jgi:hypothetical protein